MDVGLYLPCEGVLDFEVVTIIDGHTVNRGVETRLTKKGLAWKGGNTRR